MVPDDAASQPDRAGGGVHMPPLRARSILIGTLLGASAIAGMFLLAGSLEGFSHTWQRLRSGDPAWLIAGGVLELLSIAGYAALFWSVVARDAPRVGWRASLEIPLAGIAALRLLATGGAGGFAISAWALSRAGMAGREIGSCLVTTVVVQYAVYMLALIFCGVGLWLGVFSGGGSFAVTIAPALLAFALVIVVLAIAALPADAERSRIGRWLARHLGRASPGWRGRWRARLWRWSTTAASSAHRGVRAAIALVRTPRADLRTAGLLGALAYWAFDVAVLWTSFRAFGTTPPLAVVVMGYFLGTLAGLLPLPAGVGGVEGGMIGAFIAFGVPAAHAVVGTLAYRLISFWLPTFPGIAGYLGLRRTVRRWEATPAREQRGEPTPVAEGRRFIRS